MILTIRLFVAMVFIASGMLKSVNVYSFSDEIYLFREAYLPFFPQYIDIAASVAVCFAELFLGMLVLNNRHARVGMGLLLLLTTLFLYLTAANYFFPAGMGRIESCGCFGELVHLSPLATFVKSVVLWVLLLYAVFKLKHLPWSTPVMMLRDSFVVASIVVSVILPMCSLCFMDVLSHGAYLWVYVALSVAIIAFVYFVGRIHVLIKDLAVVVSSYVNHL